MEAEAEQEMEVAVMEPLTALQLLQSVYQNPTVGMTTRMRAAMACLPFEVPKLAVTALIAENDFATLLDRRLKHMEAIATGEPKMIEAREPVEVKPPTSSINFRAG